MTEQTTEPFKQDFLDGKLFAYPTEAVFGLGCDPDNRQAVTDLLLLKNRSVKKGLILIANTYSQLLPYVNDNAIPLDRRTEIFSSWPGPVTWLLPKSASAPEWITGGSDLIAVRVSNHQKVKELCERVGKPIVSTSANLTGHEPARSEEDVKRQFGSRVVLVKGKVGNERNPSIIKNGTNGQIIRAN